MSQGNNGFRSAAAAAPFKTHPSVRPSINLFLIYLARYALFSRVSLSPSLSLQIGSEVRRRSSVNPSSILRTDTEGYRVGRAKRQVRYREVGWT